jgi:1-Cys peroxiredoxin 6
MACEKGGCAAAVPSGSEAYAKLYPEQSSDGVLRLGNVVPDFQAETTMGSIKWHDWIEGGWAILFSHPADFTPVCTTEIGRMALKYQYLADKGVKVAALSCNALGEHQAWLEDVVAHCEKKVTVDFPIIADPTREIAVAYGMIDPELKDAEGLPLTCRSVFIIGPDKKLKLSLNYPASVGRNMDEIVRVVDALMLSAEKSVATPANWPNNHADQGMKGWVFLLPTVTKEDAAAYFPEHKVCQVPSGQEYLRLTPAGTAAKVPEPAGATEE